MSDVLVNNAGRMSFVHVVIDVTPYGHMSGRRTVHDILVVNTTGEIGGIANYTYMAKTIGGNLYQDATGKIEGFECSRGYLALAQAVLNKIEGA